MTNKYRIPRSRKCHAIPGIWNGKSQTARNVEKIHGYAIHEIWTCVSQGQYLGIYREKEWEIVGRHISEKMRAEPDYVHAVYKKQKIDGKKLADLSREITSADLSKKSTEALLDLYKEIEEKWISYDQYNVAPWYIGGEYFHDRVVDELARLSVTKDEIAKLLTPRKPSFSAEEELYVHQIALEIIENNFDVDHLPVRIIKKIDRLADRFFWIPFGYDGPTTYDRKHYVETIKSILKSKNRLAMQEKIADIEKYEEKLSIEHKEIIKKYSIPDDLQISIELIHLLAYMTDERKEYQFQSHVAFDKVLHVIASNLSIDYLSLKYVIWDEISKHIDNPKKIDEIGKRRLDSTIVFHWMDGVAEILEGAVADKFMSEAMPVSSDDKILNGQIGCKGRQKITLGKVKILHSSQEIGKLLPDEVLVTSMTTPEFVPAMRRSLAIITDEGGITCHAAIVSRELNIPCVIGTKFATKILKDGDMVEIDTEKGIVKIMK